jgi:hypothetical protein
MESTVQKPAFVAAKTTPKAKTIVYWIACGLPPSFRTAIEPKEASICGGCRLR